MTGAEVVLSAAETQKLQQYEEIIAAGVQTFIAVGQALVGVRDERLYRAVHSNFENYCQVRWGWSKAYAYRLISAADLSKLIMSPIGDMINFEELPANEAQFRHLSRLIPSADAPEEERRAGEQDVREVWAEAVRTTPTDETGARRVTAAHVATKVAERLGESPAPSPPPTPPAPPAPEPRPAVRRRPPLIEDFRAAVFQHGQSVARLGRVMADDRWPATAPRVPPAIARDLNSQSDALDQLCENVPINDTYTENGEQP